MARECRDGVRSVAVRSWGMELGRSLAAALGALMVIVDAWSVVGTVVVPRRVRSTLTRVLARGVDVVFHLVASRLRSYEGRDRLLAAQAPVQLMLQLLVWLGMFLLGYGLLLWPFIGHHFFGYALEESGAALTTLGYVVPRRAGEIAITILAAISGLATVALQIGYLPALYGAFNRRETLVTMLDARAGVPSWGPELLARTHYGLGTGTSALGELPRWFEQWEQWSADVAESHATYLPLVDFRSPRALSSWVTAQIAVLDAAALYLALVPDAAGAISARLCLRSGFTCLTTIARAKGYDVPLEADPDRGISLTFEEFAEAIERLRAVDFPIGRDPEQAWPEFVGWRVNYEAAAYALAFGIDGPPALWSGPRPHSSVLIPPQRPATRRASLPSAGPAEQ